MAVAASRAREALTPRLTRYIPHIPTPKQQAGLLLPQEEVLYGGAAGGGKSDWLLMAALQYVDVPGYSALLLRRSYPELRMEGGLLERAEDWLSETDAKWVASDMKWVFPSGAVLQFGHLDGAIGHLRYQGSNWQFIGFDELTQFKEFQYRYLFSRLRRPEVAEDTPDDRKAKIELLSRVPLRMRVASNPGGPGHAWVKLRWGIYHAKGASPHDPLVGHKPAFVRHHNRAFLAAGLIDNPHLDQESYTRSLAQLDPVTRSQLLRGDWSARQSGDLFKSEWFEIIDQAPAGLEPVRYWDLAATEPSQANTDPDWTSGTKAAVTPDGYWIIMDVTRFRKRPDGVEKKIQQVAALDGMNVPIWIEQEPGSSGKNTILHYQRNVLRHFEVRGARVTGSKEERARPVSAKAEAGLVKLVRGPWIPDFLDELDAFPSEEHDDQVDSTSGAFSKLSLSAGDPEVGPDIWR